LARPFVQVSDEEVRTVWQLRNKGYSIQSIGRKMGRTYHFIRRILTSSSLASPSLTSEIPPTLPEGFVSLAKDSVVSDPNRKLANTLRRDLQELSSGMAGPALPNRFLKNPPDSLYIRQLKEGFVEADLIAKTEEAKKNKVKWEVERVQLQTQLRKVQLELRRAMEIAALSGTNNLYEFDGEYAAEILLQSIVLAAAEGKTPEEIENRTRRVYPYARLQGFRPVR